MIQLRCSILSHNHQRQAARISEDLLIYDYRLGRKIPLPPWIESVFRKAGADEQESRRSWQARRNEIEIKLGNLEKKTVLSGEKEDMGSTARE